MIRFLFGVLLLAITAQVVTAQEQELPALHDVVGVAADDTLNVRETPSEDGAVIGTLAFDQTGVEVLAMAEGWALVTTGNLTGHVAARFLSRQEEPSWSALQQPLACYGTEPFWSLDLDPVAGTVEYRTPEPSEATSGKISQTWPGERWAPSAALAVPQGLAVLSPQDCSDGMSDRAFGIGIDVFLTTPPGARLAGCCSLIGR
jgi:uncharacterized membrane protein